MRTLANLAAAFAISACAFTTSAYANCARPVSYTPRVAGNTVTIAAENFEDRGCPDSSGMLRQNAATGEVVRLADFCTPSSSGAGERSYVDECVPAGKYRYGFGRPYACAPSSCGTDYFVEASVTSALDPSCQRTAGNAGPSAAASVPWGSDPRICNYGSGKAASGCATVPNGAGAVLLLDVAVAAAGILALRRVRRARG